MEQWARELKESTQAKDYELILVGPCSDSVASMRRFEGVRILQPHTINIRAMIEQAAHRLDAYFDSTGIMRVPPFVRELLVEGLVTRISEYASHGTPLQPVDLARLLNEWVLSLYPEAVTQAGEMQCTAIWNTVYVPRGPTQGLMRKPFVAPITLVNDGIVTCLIKDIHMLLSVDERRYLYKIEAVRRASKTIGRSGAIYNGHDGL